MKKTTAKRLGIGVGALGVLLAVLAFVPGFEFEGGIPGVIGASKRSNQSKQDFVIAVGKCAVKYEINYDAINDPCWGPEGISMVKGYPYFRMGTFELYAWVAR